MNRLILLGRTDDDDRVYVEIALRPQDPDRMAHTMTVDHQPVPPGVLELSICGEAWPKDRRHRDCYAAGQIVDEVGRISKPESPWTIDEIRDLVAVWQRWHLNTMKALCSHQEYRVENRAGYPRLDIDQVCEASGYKAGSAWLVDPLPQDVVDKVRGWQGRLRPLTGRP